MVFPNKTSSVKHPPQKSPGGKYVIAALLALGVAGAGGGWIYHRHVQQRAIAFWGGDAAELIVAAPKVELLKLEPEEEAERSEGDTISWRGRHWRIAARTDAAQAPGLPHLRHRLVHDASFNWSTAPDDKAVAWQYALRFSSGDRKATVLCDLEQRCTALAETGAMASIAPIRRGLMEIFGSRIRENSGRNSSRQPDFSRSQLRAGE